MLTEYVVALLRVVIGVVFMVSALGKARAFPEFEGTVSSFQIAPLHTSRSIALVLVAGEFSVVTLNLLGGMWVSASFALATMLLAAFAIAMISVLQRNIRTTCGCFGPSEREVSPPDIWRNVGLILCSASGFVIGSLGNTEGSGLSLIGWLLMGVGAVAFVIVWMQLGEITLLFDRR